MREGAITKMYIAYLCAAPDEEYGVIDLHMKRCAESIITRRVCDPTEEKARRAVTVYKKIYTDEKSGECLVIAAPVTGRTHQLRVHFSAIGCPMVGDYLYSQRDERIGRHALHASFLSFLHPEDGRTVSVFSPLPDEIGALLSPDILSLAENELRTESCGHLKELYDKMKKDI